MDSGTQPKKGNSMFNRHLFIASLMAAATCAGLALSAYATDDPKASTGHVATAEALDATLGERVETLLRSDVGLAGSRFRVAAKAAAVTVGGSVPDEHALRRALDLASGVRGVREVHNAMEVDPPK